MVKCPPPKGFLRSTLGFEFLAEILAKSDFFGSMKDARIFLGCVKTRGIFLDMLK